MQLHQLNLQFDPEQDRLIFRMNTTQREEIRFYLTRRFVRLLWPVLQDLLKNDFRRREPETAHLADTMLAFEQESVVSRMDTSQDFARGGEQFPLGKKPVLLSRIKVKKMPRGGDMLCLHPREGQGIEFPVNSRFLHMFCSALKDVIKKAQWDLELAEAESPLSPAEGRLLH